MVRDDLILFINPPTLTTKRLMLRKIKKCDLDDIFEYKSDPLVTEHLLYNPHKSKKDTEAYINNTINKYREGKMYDFAVVLSENGKTIGVVGFTTISINDNSAEIGYVFNRAYWGYGLASEAVSELIDFGFKVLKLDKIYAKILAKNEQSINLAKRCGLKIDRLIKRAIFNKGAYRDMVICSIDKCNYN